MKKVISLSAVIMLSYVALAQDSIPKSNANPHNNLDTMSRPRNHSKDTSTKNWNSPKHTDSTNTGSNTMSSGTGSNNNTMSSDSTTSNSATTVNGSNNTMSNDSSSMSSNNNHNHMDSISRNSGSQSSTLNNTATTNSATITADSIKAYEKTLTDRVLMKDDKMYMLKDGEATPLEKSYKLSSGAVVSTLGTVKYPGGKVITLKNGQFIEIKPATTQTERTKKSTKAVVVKKRVKTQSK